jgi:hypothetical protein
LHTLWAFDPTQGSWGLYGFCSCPLVPMRGKRHINLRECHAIWEGLSLVGSNADNHCKPKTPLHFPYTCERTECKVGIQEIWRV